MNNLSAQVNHILIILFSLLFPITVAGGNLIAGLIVIYWLVSGNYKEKFRRIFTNKFAVACILFFMIHVIGLIWSDDLYLGIERIKKMHEFGLFIPILLTIIEKRHTQKYLHWFLISVSITFILSFLIYLGLIPPFKSASVSNPTPFVSHISHSPMMAIASYIGLRLLISKGWNYYMVHKVEFFWLLFITIFAGINVFITGGRAGYVIFLILVGLTLFQIYQFSFKGILIAAASYSLIIFLAFQYSPMFKSKVVMSKETIKNIENNELSSIGKRIIMAENSFQIFLDNPIIGTGIGDFSHDYENILNERKIQNQSLEVLNKTTKNPHNMYLLLAAELGLLGLFFIFYLFYQHFSVAQKSSNNVNKDILIAIGVAYLFLNFSDSYLLGHHSSFLYAFLVSILIANVDEETI